MLRIFMLCTCVNVALFKSLNNLYELQEFDKGVAIRDSLKDKDDVVHSQSEEISYDNDDAISGIIDNRPDVSDVRRSNRIRYIKDLVFLTPEENYNKNENKNITSLLLKLTDAVNNLNNNLRNINQNTYLLRELRLPVERRRRFKRDTATDTSVLNLTVNNTVSNSNRAKEDQNVTVENNSDNNNYFFTNDTSSLLDELPIFLNNTSNTDAEVSGRRFMITPEPMRVKEKMLQYLDDMFTDIESKINPLTKVKLALSSDNSYRTGYVIANIDTLDVNLKKLKNEMKKNGLFWNDSKVVELFDKLRDTNKVISTLLQTLKPYLPRT